MDHNVVFENVDEEVWQRKGEVDRTQQKYKQKFPIHFT